MKKGFTLVELLAVITILGIIAIIITPTVENSNKKIKQKAYDKQKEALLISLNDYRTSSPDYLAVDTMSVTLKQLKDLGFVDYDVKNPKTGKCLDNNTVFKIEKLENKTYKYYINNKLFEDADLVDTNNNDCKPQ